MRPFMKCAGVRKEAADCRQSACALLKRLWKKLLLGPRFSKCKANQTGLIGSRFIGFTAVCT